MCYSGFGSRSCTAAQLSHTDREPKTEHAEYAEVVSFPRRVQHVCFVKLGVGVLRKLFGRAKSLLRCIDYCWIMNVTNMRNFTGSWSSSA